MRILPPRNRATRDVLADIDTKLTKLISFVYEKENYLVALTQSLTDAFRDLDATIDSAFGANKDKLAADEAKIAADEAEIARLQALVDQGGVAEADVSAAISDVKAHVQSLAS